MSSPLKYSHIFCSGRFSLLITASWLFKILVIELYGNYWIGQKVHHDFSIKCNEKTWMKFLATWYMWSSGPDLERVWKGELHKVVFLKGIHKLGNGMGLMRAWAIGSEKRGEGIVQAKWTSLQHWGLNSNFVSGKFCLGIMMDTARPLRCRLGGQIWGRAISFLTQRIMHLYYWKTRICRE